MPETNIQATISVNDEMTAALRRIEDTLKSFGQKFQSVGKQVGSSFTAASTAVDKGTSKVVDGLGAMDKASVQSLAKMGKFTSRIIGAQGIANALGQLSVGAGSAGKAIASFSVGLNTAAGIVGAFPTPMGIAVGALAGLGMALMSSSSDSKKLEESLKSLIERSRELAKEIKNMPEEGKLLGQKHKMTRASVAQRESDQLELLMSQVGRLPEFKKDTEKFFRDTVSNAGEMFGDLIPKEVLERWNSFFDQGRFEEIRKDLVTIQKRMADAGGALGGFSDEAFRSITLIEDALRNATDAAKLFADPEKTIANQRAKAEMAKVSEEIVKIQKAYEDVARVSSQKVELGILDPITAAEEKLQAAKKTTETILQLAVGLERFAEQFGDKLDERTRQAVEGMIKALRNTGLGQAVGTQKGADRDARDKRAAKERQQRLKEQLQRELELQEQERQRMESLWSEMDPTIGWERALEDLKDKFLTFRDVAREVMLSIEQGFSQVFLGLMDGGKKFKDRMKSFFKDIGNSFKRMLADMLGQQLRLSMFPAGGSAPSGPAGMAGGFSMAAGASGALAGLGGGLGGQSVGGGVSTAAGAASGNFLSSLFSGGGLGAVGGPLVGLAGLGIGMAGIQAGKPALSALGGAMAGFAIGGPIGGLIGGAVGLIGGLFSKKKKKKAKKKAKKQAEEAARQLAAAQEAQRKEAERLALMHIRSTMGGGLATTGAAEEIGAMFSGGLSIEELNKLGGADTIVGKKDAIENQNKIVNIAEGAVKIEATVAGSYDIRSMLEDVNAELGQLGNI